MDNQSEEVFQLHYKALTDSFRGVRNLALQYINTYLGREENDSLMPDIRKIAESDPNSGLRSMAIKMLVRHFEDSSLIDLYLKGLDDSSYAVLSASFQALSEKNEVLAIEQAKRFESIDDENIILTLTALYAHSDDTSHNAFFKKQFDRSWGFGKYTFVLDYGEYLKNQEDIVIVNALPFLNEVSIAETAWWNRLAGMSIIMNLHTMYQERIESEEKVLNEMEMDDAKRDLQEKNLNHSIKILAELEVIWDQINETETNTRLISVIDAYNKGVNILEE